MSLRQKLWARRTLDAQTEALGGECVACGSTEALEKDCIVPQGDEHHKMSTDQKATFYRRQMIKDNLQLLCSKCHTKKNAMEQKAAEGIGPKSRNRQFVDELQRRLVSLGDWRGPVSDDVTADSTGESQQPT